MDRSSESIDAFSKIFPDEASCVRWLLNVRFGLNTPCELCGEVAAWRYQGSSSEYFRHCCRRIYPRVGTLAAFSNLPLRTWFFGIMLVSNFDGRVSTDFLARHLGLGVVAARRVSLRIRLHMTALALRESCPLEGPVYVDEMFLSAVSNAQRELDHPVVIFGIANKTDVRLFCVPNRKARTLGSVIQRHVAVEAKIVADGLASYDSLSDRGFLLSRVNHTRAIWRNSAGDSTARLEQVWTGLRRRLEGVHGIVAADKLWTYLGQHMFLLRCRANGLTPLWESLNYFPNIWQLEEGLRTQIDLR